MKVYQEKIASKFKEPRLLADIGTIPKLEDWGELLEDNEDFVEEFHRLYDNTDVPEVDNEFDLDTYNTYLNMELAIDMGCHEHPQYAKVTKQLKDHCGNPIGTANNNPILDTRMYKVEFADGSKQALVANIIAENMFASVDKEGH